MKIVQVVNSLRAGGAEVFVSQLSVALANEGHDVSLITYQGTRGEKGEILERYLKESGVKIIHFKRGNKGYSKYIKPFLLINNEIKKIDPEIIHAHLQWSDIYIALVKLLSLNKYKIVRTVHNPRRTAKLSQFLDRIFYNFYDRNIGCSDSVKENYIDPKLRDLIVSIPNGIDISIISNKKQQRSKSGYRSQLNISNEKTVFINIGSMHLSDNEISAKNHMMIIEALNGLPNKEDLLLILLGDGLLRKALEDKCVEYGLQDVVRFEGNVGSPYEYIFASDFCVMPSLSEGLPIALIEIVCGGLSAIVSKITAFKPFRSNSILNLKTFDIKELSDSMQHFINEKDLYLKLGSENAVYFESIFDIKQNAKKHLLLYMDVIIK